MPGSQVVNIILRSLRFRLCRDLVLLLSLWSCSGLAFANDKNQAAEQQRLLPLWSAQARERGIELPLPFGITVTDMDMEDRFIIDRLQVDANSGLPGMGSVDITGTESDINAWNVRIDAWLLPFLNVYVVGGGLRGDSITTAVVEIGPVRQESKIVTDFNGKTYGAGFTLAGGYDRYIATVDVSYAETDLNLVSSRIRSLTITPQVGITGKLGEFPARLMVGGMHMDILQSLQVDVPAPNQSEPIVVEQRVEPRHKWNNVITGQVEFSEHWHGLLQFGFNQRDHLLGGFVYRF